MVSSNPLVQVVGLDHVVLVKVASTAVVSQLLSLEYDEIVNAVSQAWVDGQSLRTYRHAPNTGPRANAGTVASVVVMPRPGNRAAGSRSRPTSSSRGIR